jgi:alcohol dehydrogenase
LRSVPLPTLAEGELLVRVRICTLCGSDLHTYSGKRQAPTPTILGHEILGDIVEIGSGDRRKDLAGRRLEVGQRVTWSIAANCGECYYCTHGLPQKCERLFKYGHERLNGAHALSGGLAEHCHLTAHTPVLVVPESLSDEVACIANCAAATVAAAMRVGAPQPGENVLIFGAGMLGLIATAMARQSRAASVTVVDVDRNRLELAKRFGATLGVIFDNEDLMVASVKSATEGRGADLALELSGAALAMEASLKALRLGGRAVFVGAVAPGRPLAIDGETIVRRVLSIHGMHNYMPRDLVAAVDFLAATAGRFPFRELVSGPFDLAQAEQAFESAIGSRALRVAVKPWVSKIAP